jgi:glyoxylase-like metal-dependent hydrolase (beta-lactamase superfamily II)
LVRGRGTHASVAVEFRDFITVIEAPLNEDRSLAVIAEVKKLIPNKPIRYLVSTHHHWDHLGGVRAYVQQEGVTIVLQQANHSYYAEVLWVRPWTLKPTGWPSFRQKRSRKATRSRRWAKNMC